MSRFSAPRASTAVAVVAAIVAVLAVMFPGLGLGQTTGVKGGSPTAVYMNKNSGFCAEVDNFGGSVISQEVTLDAESHLVTYFTFEWGTLSERLEGLISFALLDATREFPENVVAGSNEWGFPGNRIPRTSSTVMWSFENVPPGTYQVHGTARVDQAPAGGQPGTEATAGLNECALTVFVIPAAIAPPPPSVTQSPPSPSPFP
jgi:hypothetical protein